MQTLNVQSSNGFKKYSFYNDKELHDSDLFKPYQQLKIRLAKQYARKMYKRAHLPEPKILIADMGWQTTSITQYHGTTLGTPTYLLLSNSNIREESMRSIKSDINHEIGHNFAPMIMAKHNLPVSNRKLWPVYHIFIFYRILLLILSVLFMAELVPDHDIALLLSYVFILGMNVLSKFIIKRCSNSINGCSRREPEFIADEFSLKATHDLRGALNSVYENHMNSYHIFDCLAEFDRSMLMTKNNTAKETQRYQNSLCKDLKARIHDFDISWNGTDNNHPSDRDRVDRLLWFWKTGMKHWR